MQAVPAILMAAGTVAQMSAADKQADERRTILNRQLDREEEATSKAAQLVQDEGQRYTMQAREEALAGNEKKAYDQAQADLQGAGGASIAAAADNANVSGDFLKTKATRAVEEGNRLTAVAREAAKARAPGMLGLDDSLSMAGLAGQQSNLWGGIRNMNRASGIQAESVQEPGYGGLGRIATAVGGHMAAGGFGQSAMGGGVPPNPYARGGINFGGYRG